MVRSRKCGPGVWTHLATTTNLILCSVSVIILLSFLTSQNLHLSGWLVSGRPTSGLAGLFTTLFLRWDFLSKFGDIYLIPSVQPALMGAVPMLRMLKPPFTVRSHLDFTSHKHTHTHTLIYTRIHSFSKYPKDLIFRYLLFTVWQKKMYNLKKYFSHIVVLFMYIFCSYFVPCELDFYSSRLYYYCPCKWALNKDYKNQVLFD